MLVRNETVSYGDNAKQIWKALTEENRVDEHQLQLKTQMNVKDVHTAIGWLARENKIRKDDNRYLLSSETNLTEEIGSLAGRIWKILDIWNEADVFTIKKLADAEDTQIYTALGWLAREGKIEVDEKNTYRLK